MHMIKFRTYEGWINEPLSSFQWKPTKGGSSEPNLLITAILLQEMKKVYNLGVRTTPDSHSESGYLSESNDHKTRGVICTIDPILDLSCGLHVMTSTELRNFIDRWKQNQRTTIDRTRARDAFILSSRIIYK